jgi:MioC protein
MTQLNILVGTVTNTAEYVAQAIEMECADLAQVSVVMMQDATADTLLATRGIDAITLICTATFGAGEVPDNAFALFQQLETDKPDLSGVRYNVLGLGDSSTHAATFNFAGKKFDALLSQLGAQRVGEPHWLDGADGQTQEADGAAWARPWLEAATAAV